MRVGFIGLGHMGQPMARNLARTGHELKVYNRTRNRAEELKAENTGNVTVADSPADAAREVDVLITMLADDQAVADVVFGGGDSPDEKARGVLYALSRGATHVSMSTIGVALSERLAKAHREAEQSYLAAPVFGRPEAANEAKIWIVAAGPSKDVEKCRPLFDAMGQGVFTAGEEAPKANVIKVAGNFTIASMIETLGEAYALVRKSGIEAQQFLEIVNTALFNSPVYQNYGTIIAKERYEPAGFKLRLGFKDTRLVLASSEELLAPMPLASLIHDRFLSCIARGFGDIDWAGLARVSAENAGLEKTETQRVTSA